MQPEEKDPDLDDAGYPTVFRRILGKGKDDGFDIGGGEPSGKPLERAFSTETLLYDSDGMPTCFGELPPGQAKDEAKDEAKADAKDDAMDEPYPITPRTNNRKVAVKSSSSKKAVVPKQKGGTLEKIKVSGLGNPGKSSRIEVTGIVDGKRVHLLTASWSSWPTAHTTLPAIVEDALQKGFTKEQFVKAVKASI